MEFPMRFKFGDDPSSFFPAGDCCIFGIDDMIMGGLSLVGGIMGQNATDDRLQAQMDFQRQMSNTAYRRSMKDMRLAGLNPILAYQKGPASSPSGAFAAATDIVSPAVNSAMASKRLTPEVANMMATNDLIKAQTNNAATQDMMMKAQTGMYSAMTASQRADALIKAEALKVAMKEAQTAETDAAVRGTEAGTAARRIGTFFRDLFGFSGAPSIKLPIPGAP